MQKVFQLIVDVLMQKYIKKPEGNQLKDVVQVLERKWGFPQCAGAIDGCHIPIVAPPEYNTDYRKLRNFHR